MVLHVLIYAADLHFWRRCRVNYPFIFGSKRGTELGCQGVFLLGSGLAVLATASFLASLYLDQDHSTRKYRTEAEKVPLGTIAVRSLEHIKLLRTNFIYNFHKYTIVSLSPNASLYNILCVSSFFLCAAYSSRHLLPIQHSIQVEQFFLFPLYFTLYMCSSVQGNKIEMSQIIDK